MCPTWREKCFALFAVAFCLSNFISGVSAQLDHCCRRLTKNQRFLISCFGCPAPPQMNQEKSHPQKKCCRWKRNERILNFTGYELGVNDHGPHRYGVYSCSSVDESEMYATTAVYPPNCESRQLEDCPVEVIITPLNATHMNVSCELLIDFPSLRCDVSGGKTLGLQKKPHNTTEYKCSCRYRCRDKLTYLESRCKQYHPHEVPASTATPSVISATPTIKSNSSSARTTPTSEYTISSDVVIPTSPTRQTDHHCSIISPQAVGIFFAGFIASSITFLIAGALCLRRVKSKRKKLTAQQRGVSVIVPKSANAASKQEAEFSIQVRDGETVVRYNPPPGSPANTNSVKNTAQSQCMEEPQLPTTIPPVSSNIDISGSTVSNNDHQNHNDRPQSLVADSIIPMGDVTTPEQCTHSRNDVTYRRRTFSNGYN